MRPPLRLMWSERALKNLARVAERSPKQADSVINALEWLAETGFSLGAKVDDKTWYWPVPPHGVYYRVRGADLFVIRVRDVRRRRAPQP